MIKRKIKRKNDADLFLEMFKSNWKKFIENILFNIFTIKNFDGLIQ